ncbi:MAG: hypothetical protein EP326_13430 [Deltaproteobacteria bacterium]|nr:MAG: hypothetical protein EP326_13430 [Deltaproteobacteria bacterium]
MKVIVYLSLYSLLLNTAFAADKKITFRDYLFDHYANFFHSKFRVAVDGWNTNHKNPNKLLALVENKKDRQALEKGLIESGIKKFPKLVKSKKGYVYDGKDITVTFSIVDAFEGQVWINNKKFKVNPGESVEARAARMATFMKTSSFNPFPFIEDAHAIIPCGGLCWGALFVATIAAGVAVYNSAMNVVGGGDDYEQLKRMSEDIKGSAAKCKEEHLRVSVYSTNLHSYKTTAPGNYQTFKILRKILKEEANPDLRDIKDHLYLVFGKDISDCKKFAKKLHGSASLTERRLTFLSTIEGEVCKDYEELSSCLDEFAQIHYSHQGKRNNNATKYNEDLGVYGDQSPIGIGSEQ